MRIGSGDRKLPRRPTCLNFPRLASWLQIQPLLRRDSVREVVQVDEGMNDAMTIEKELPRLVRTTGRETAHTSTPSVDVQACFLAGHAIGHHIL